MHILFATYFRNISNPLTLECISADVNPRRNFALDLKTHNKSREVIRVEAECNSRLHWQISLIALVRALLSRS